MGLGHWVFVVRSGGVNWQRARDLGTGVPSLLQVCISDVHHQAVVSTGQSGSGIPRFPDHIMCIVF